MQVLLADTFVNAQSSSPLFRHIPPELRQIIFDFALTEEYAATETWPQWDCKNDVGKLAWWVRPDYLGRKIVFTSVLRTCKRVYIESRGFVGKNKTHIFWHGQHRGPRNLPFHDEHSYFERFTTAQLSTIKAIRLHIPSVYLAAHLHMVCRLNLLQNIEILHLTLRRSDWLHWESNAKMALNPTGPDRGQHPSQFQMSVQVGNVPVDTWSDMAWGSAFKNMPMLKEILLELESTIDRGSELMALVQDAQEWKFPRNDGGVFTCRRVDMSRWRGPYCNWNSVCSVCNRWRWARLPPTGTNLSQNLDICHESLEFSVERLGPELALAKLTFR